MRRKGVVRTADLIGDSARRQALRLGPHQKRERSQAASAARGRPAQPARGVRTSCPPPPPGLTWPTTAKVSLRHQSLFASATRLDPDDSFRKIPVSLYVQISRHMIIAYDGYVTARFACGRERRSPQTKQGRGLRTREGCHESDARQWLMLGAGNFSPAPGSSQQERLPPRLPFLRPRLRPAPARVDYPSNRLANIRDLKVDEPLQRILSR